MRIGILTYHNIPNYGANLQALCTSAALAATGNDVYVFNYVADDLDRVYREHVSVAQYMLHKEFAEQNLPLTSLCRTGKDLAAITRELNLDLVIVGSDAVFRVQRDQNPGTHSGYPNVFWLKWTKDLDVRRAALSATCMGINFFRYRGDMKAGIRADLRAWDYVSVRDVWTKCFVLYLGRRESHLSVDPTSILPEILSRLAGGDLPPALEGRRYLVTTFGLQDVNLQWMKTFCAYAHRHDVLVCAIPHPDRRPSEYPADVNIREPLHPLQWLQILRNSVGYIGERFHPALIALLLGKPAISVDTYSQTARSLHGLLKMRSKTYDMFRRGRLERYVIPSDQFFGQSPKCVFKAIHGFDKSRAHLFGARCRERFRATLRDIANLP